MVVELKYDTPLADPKHDNLGRKDFSQMLAKSIIGLDANEGFVYSIYGPWGSGKSTVINFVEHYLQEHNKQADNKIVVFKFNPWMFSGSESLTRLFLDQLRVRLGMSDVAASLHAVSKKLGIIEGALSLSDVALSAFIPGAGGVIGWMKGCLKGSKEAAGVVAESLQKDLYHIKEEIVQALQEQDDKILIVIDDLDRLLEDEIRDLVKLIKSVCDFPKIIYLIACDSDKVAAALSKDKSEKMDGYAYLEKIVQCSFNLPKPNKHGLWKMFTQGVDSIVFPVKHEELLFDSKDWGNIFHEGIAPLLETPRNVKTLLNSVAACYPAVRDEVNIVSFIGIQAVRVFFPREYLVIENNKDMFAGETYGSRSDHMAKIRQVFFKDLNDGIPKNRLEVFKSLMGRLFPPYAQFDGGSGYGSEWLSEWKKNRKICSPECFDVYFSLSISGDGFTLQEMMSIIALATDPPALKEKLRQLSQQKTDVGTSRYQIFLTELEGYTKQEIPADAILPFLQAIYDISDTVEPDDESRGFMEFGIRMSMLRISYQLITRLELKSERFDLLKKIFEKSESVSLVVDDASLLSRKEEKVRQDSSKDNTVEPEHVTTLVAIALEKIKEFVIAKKLAKVPELAALLYRWKAWEGDEPVKKYVADLITSDEGFIDFITGFLSVGMSHSMGDTVVTRNYRVRHKNIKEFLATDDLTSIVQRAKNLLTATPTLTARQKKAIEVFVEEHDNPEKYKRDW